MRLQGTKLENENVIPVPKTIKDFGQFVVGKRKGYKLMSSNLRRRARKMVSKIYPYHLSL